jgi:hypothetical protein
MPIKRYESKYEEEHVILTLASGKKINIAFKGGGQYPKPHGGNYITDNREIQDAIEARNDFNTKWKITLNSPTKQESEMKIPAGGNEILDIDNPLITPPPGVDLPAETQNANELHGKETSENQDITTQEAAEETEIPAGTEETEKPAEAEKEIPATSAQANPTGSISIMDVTTFQQVRNYLCVTYPGTTFADVRSKEAAKKLALEKKITFPNWVE